MFRTTLTSTLLLAATLAGGGLRAATFEPQPFLADGGVDVLDRQVTRQLVDRDLFSAPWATVVLGRVDVYATFPYLESRYFQVVSDPGWSRLVYGEMGQGLKAWDGAGTAFGPLAGPRGLAWRASIGKGPVAQLTDPQVRQVVGYVMSRDEVKAAVKGFMGDAAQGAEG